MNPQEYVIAAMDADNKTFVIHVAIWEQEEMPVHSERQAQVRVLLFDKAFTLVPAEYSNYSDVFSAENAAELPENTGINEHLIKLEKGKQLPFGPIYSLGPVELETLKTYIEANLANGLSGFPSPPPKHLFSLTGSRIKTSAFAWIIEASIISLLKTNICSF